MMPTLQNFVAIETPKQSLSNLHDDGSRDGRDGGVRQGPYRVYKRRFFGLIQLVLLNIVINWGWLTFSAVSTSSAQYFNVSESTINWLSTGYLFASFIVAPMTIYAVNHGGPKQAMIVSSTLTLLGNWIRYAGTKANGGIFGLVMLGQILIGFAQPFCLTTPTRYSDLWFSDRGRISATALATLSNPLGAALGQLVDSALVNQPSDIPNVVLYLSIISSVAAIPSFFIPASPPTPPSASVLAEKIPLMISLRRLFQSLEFWLILIPFGVYVGFFNSTSSLLNQIFSPYGYSQTDAGIAGGLLIIVGLVSAAVVSPIIDRSKHYLGAIRIMIPIIAASYVALIFTPSSPAGIAPSFVVCAFLGASSFSLLPLILEYLVEITYPMPPEVGSTIVWSAGMLLGALFTMIQDALKAGPNANPPYHMQNALIFSGVISLAAAPCALSLGLFGRKIKRRRLEVDLEFTEAIKTAPVEVVAGGSRIASDPPSNDLSKILI